MRRNAKKLHKHELYQISVQNAPFESHFLQRVYQKRRGKKPKKLREDFCGTALLTCEWARRVRDGRALGVDLDGETLDWGREHNLASLNDAGGRVRLMEGNVLHNSDGRFRPDVVAALNFSYFVFKTRDLLLSYFRRVHRTLAPGGMFFLDIYGGPQAQVVQEETTQQPGFKYVWDQAHYNPITGDYLCYIHFDFPDGSRMRRAFTYDWRLWGLPEVRDALAEAGFRRSEVYWEGTDKESGGGNGVFRPSKKGDDAESWVAYIVAEK